MKNFLLVLIIPICFIAISCKNDDTPTPEPVTNSSSFSNIPDAKAENDTKSGGVYKGVLMGSSGDVKIVLQDGNVYAIVSFDGVTKTLTTTSLSGWTSGQAITNAIFTADTWQLTFSVDADGSNPQLSVNIPGHTVEVALLKETSTDLTRTFRGTYTRSDNLTFTLNCVIKGSVVKFPGLSSVGSLSGNTISLNAPEKDFTLEGTINGDNISGTGISIEVDGSGGTTNLTGTWTAKRTY